jgi:hypothetical protein
MDRMRNGLRQLGLLLVLLPAACGRGDASNGTVATGGAQAPAGPVQTDTLTGLYESGSGPRRNQLCMIARDGGNTGFGFVAWSSGDPSCSASGVAQRDGNRLRLLLDGDQSCALEARIDGGRVTFPTNVPEACQRYYCGPGAQMAGVQFDKVGGGEADALRATDLVGDPLCGR